MERSRARKSGVSLGGFGTFRHQAGDDTATLGNLDLFALAAEAVRSS